MKQIDLEPLQETDIQWMMSAGKVSEIAGDRLVLTQACGVDNLNILLEGQLSYG